MPTTTEQVTLENIQNRRRGNPPTAELRIANTLEQIGDTLEALNRNMIELLKHIQNEEEHLK